MGWVDGEFYSLKQQLEAKEGLVKKEKKRIASMKFSSLEQIERLRTPINQYYRAIGYVLEKNLTLQELKRIAGNLPDMPKSAYEDSDIATNLVRLKKEREQFRSDRSDVNSLIQQIDDNSSDAHDYANALNHLTSVNNFGMDSESIECPMCHSKSPETEAAVQAVISSREELLLELQSVGSYAIDSSEHLKELLKKRDLFKRNIRKISAEISEFEKVLNISDEDQALRDSIMKLKGRIEVILEHILHKPTLDQAPFDLEELQGEIDFIKDQLDGYDLESKVQEANVFLSENMTKISDKLDFEKELKPGRMHFDLDSFDFYYVYEKQKIRLSEMGSGANWLACHLSLFLSLLHLSCKEKGSCVPSFLFIDQPSQVYFPKATKVLLKEGDQALDTNEGEEFDENIKQVINIFKIALYEIKLIQKECGFMPQLIVMEHADEKEFNEFVKKRWAANGEKLI
jgi:hypothetical protein